MVGQALETAIAVDFVGSSARDLAAGWALWTVLCCGLVHLLVVA